MASTYLSKTFGSAGNRKTFTVSFWFKLGSVPDSASVNTIGSGVDNTNDFMIGFSYDTARTTGIHVLARNSGTKVVDVQTNRKFRDLSAWYHAVIAVDTTQSTDSDRVKIYINGSQETSLLTSTYPSQNTDLRWNTATAHYIGTTRDNQLSTNLFDGLMAHVHSIDGTSYDADTFGETDSTSGIWKPKTGPSVTYGTNGFFLKFQDSSSLGDDSSGNTNDFTLSGSGKQILDTPSNVFATLNPLAGTAIGSYTNGNNRIVGVASSWTTAPSTFAVSSGKWYCEAKAQYISLMVGILDIDQMIVNNYQGTKSNGWGYETTGTLWNNGSGTTSWGATYTTGDIVGIAMDLDNNKLYFSKNGSWQNSADPAAGTGGVSITADKTYYFAMSPVDSTSAIIETNFGKRLLCNNRSIFSRE